MKNKVNKGKININKTNGDKMTGAADDKRGNELIKMT